MYNFAGEKEFTVLLRLPGPLITDESGHRKPGWSMWTIRLTYLNQLASIVCTYTNSAGRHAQTVPSKQSSE